MIQHSEAWQEPRQISNPEVLAAHLSHSDFPLIIGFGRTGTHWLRALIELYFKRPLLPWSMFYGDQDDFIAFHTLDIYRLVATDHPTVYVYRDPVDVIYSACQFTRDNSLAYIQREASRYQAHLNKWLAVPNVCAIRYERLRDNIQSEFGKVVKTLGGKVDEERILEVAQQVTKALIAARGWPADSHRLAVDTPEYEAGRAAFRVNYGNMILEVGFGTT